MVDQPLDVPSNRLDRLSVHLDLVNDYRVMLAHDHLLVSSSA
jgi:hypothetical protein